MAKRCKKCLRTLNLREFKKAKSGKRSPKCNNCIQLELRRAYKEPEDLGAPYRIKLTQRYRRKNSEGKDYICCKFCKAWKPENSKYFFKKYLDPKEPLTFRTVCRDCTGSGGSTLPARNNKRAGEYVWVLLRLRKKGGYYEHIGVFSTRKGAFAKLQEQALEHDPAFEETGMSKLFVVHQVQVKE